MFERLSKLRDFKLESLLPVNQKKQDEMLYQQLAELLVQTRSSLRSIKSIPEELKSIEHAIEQESDGQKKLDLSNQYNALKTLLDYQSGNFEALVERVLSRDGLDSEQAEDLLNQLSGIGKALSSVQHKTVDLDSVLENLGSILADNRVNSKVRSTTLNDLTTYANAVGETPVADSLRDITPENLDAKESKKKIDLAIKSLRKEATASKQIQVLLKDEQHYDQEVIDSLKRILDESGTHSQILQDLKSIEQDSNLDANSKSEQTQALLKRLRSQVYETKVLQSLRDLNNSFDQSTATQQEMIEALEQNNLGTQLKERPEFVTKGAKGLTKTLAGGLMSALGLTAFDEIFGISDMISDKMEDKVKTRPNSTSGSGGRNTPSSTNTGKKGIFGKAANLAMSGAGKIGVKGLAVGGGVLAAGLAALDYANSENTAERKDAVGTGVGAAIGGALGTLIPVPVVGTLVGAAVGSWLGSKFSDWFTNPEDLIPDKVKDLGPIEQVAYIEDTLVPQLIRSGQADEKTLGKLRTYEERLLNKGDLKAWLDKQYEKVGKPLGQTREQFDRSMLSSPIVQKLNYTTQDKIASATGKPDALIDPSATRGADGKFKKRHDVKPVSKEVLAASDVGFVSQKYESGRKGVSAISSGIGDPGGVSYGTYQLATKTGTMSKFLESKEASNYADKFKGLTPGSAEFNKVYAEVASSDGENFNKAQHDFIKRTHYDPVATLAQKYGYDINDRATQEMLWSQSVQHGYGGNQKIFERLKARGIDPSKASKEDLIRETYAERAAYTSQFANVGNRYAREVEDVLAVNAASKQTDVAASTTTATPVANAQTVTPVPPSISMPTATAQTVTPVAPSFGTEKADQVTAAFTQATLPKEPKGSVNVTSSPETSKPNASPIRQTMIDNYGIAFANSMLFGR